MQELKENKTSQSISSLLDSLKEQIPTEVQKEYGIDFIKDHIAINIPVYIALIVTSTTKIENTDIVTRIDTEHGLLTLWKGGKPFSHIHLVVL